MMNDEQFELTISDLAGSGTYYADIADELRARDTAQREALARVEADNRQLQLIVNSHANMRDTAQAQLAEAVGLLNWLKTELDDFPSLIRVIDKVLARHALATQPAAGEPVAWMYDTPNNGRQYSDKRLDHYWRDALKDSYVKGVPLYDAPPAAAHGDDFQARVQPWMLECFGEMIAGDREERNHRFLEEALELVQSTGCTAGEAHQLVDYVFGRPVGEPAQEVGGVMVTLAALCLANSLDMHDAAEVELARIWTKVEAIRAKQAAKPKHSPLPIAAAHGDEAVRKPELVGYFSFCEDKQKWLQQKSKGAEFNHLFTPLYAMRAQGDGGSGDAGH